MKKIALLSICAILASCNYGAEHDKKVWGGYSQDYNRKAETKLIRSKEIDSGSDCIGQNLDGICHGTVVPNE